MSHRPRLVAASSLIALTLALSALTSACNPLDRRTDVTANTEPYTRAINQPWSLTLDPSGCTFDADSNTVTAPLTFIGAPGVSTTVEFNLFVRSGDASYDDWSKDFKATMPKTGGIQHIKATIKGVTDNSWAAVPGCNFSITSPAS